MESTQAVTNLHEALEPISFLCGRWFTNEGQGKYPNIPEFKYHEEIEFLCFGQPMFNFLSTSSHPEKGTRMHQERGFLRIKPGTTDIAFMVSHNFGLTSLEEGSCYPDRKEITLNSVNIARMSFSKPPHVTALKRCIKLIDPDTLEIILYMQTENTPLTEHLRAVYKKIY